ncbi:hypothetical protein HUW51_23125 [Adhaeribacter swui]|uniref:Uncharacterized protein n=1 Tax=Adhaeribacter swui TaxID=2086471 RepID=A0A7G7GE75_9BACT|nr:hypothetical protein [Adhaeribacter swui]QNF35459.1 hypothetical protein HUW51_23125 [Adhaeribacter swui]
MFELFKKSRWKIEGAALNFFHSIFCQLPIKYEFLLQGLHKGLYKSYFINYAMPKNNYAIGFDPSQSDKEVIKGLRFKLNNIQIIENERPLKFDLIVFDGLWSGFEFEKNILHLKDHQIDTSKLEEIKILNNELSSLIGDLKSDKLDLYDLSDIEVDNKEFYQIKDLEDGNYLCIDRSGKVYGLFHDPFEVELISSSLRKFVGEVNSGEFDIDNYLRLKRQVDNKKL